MGLVHLKAEDICDSDPAWYCTIAVKPKLQKKNGFHLNPTTNTASEACECGSSEFRGEADVLDTWMDSSISALHVSGWLSDHPLLLPAQLRPRVMISSEPGLFTRSSGQRRF